MKRAAECFVTVCFLAFLGAGLAATVLRRPETVSYFENRALAAFPARSAQSIGDGSYAAQLETYLDDHAALRNTLLACKTRIDLALRRPVVNEVVVTKERLLPYMPPNRTDPDTVAGWAANMADNLKRISDTVEEYGGYYCYVGVPCQYAYFADSYPWYLSNWKSFTHSVVSSMEQAMAERDIGFLDIGAVYAALGSPPEYSSAVDNHYSMEGAFLAYRAIMEKVAAETGLDFPILDRDDLVFETLPNEYIGSRERKLINVETREESLIAAYPKQEIPYDRSDNGVETIPYVYALPATDWEPVTYNMYMGGDIANTVIDTHREDLPSILIYGDSFTNALECVAYLSFDEMHSLDLRHYQAMSLEEYIREFQPEVVICIRDYDVLLYPSYNGGAD